MIRHHIEDHPDLALVCFFNESFGVGDGAEERIDVAIIGDVVTTVALRARKDGAEPYGIHTECLQIIETGRCTGQVADTIPVAIGE